MKKVFAAIFVFMFSFVNLVYANSYDGWMTVNMANEIEFQIPPTLEMQTERYINQIKNNAPQYMYDMMAKPTETKYIIQQRGLNDGSPDALKHFVRIFISIIDNEYEMPRFGEQLDVTKDELDEFNGIFLQAPGLVDIINPVHITDIDGKQAVRITYATQFPGYPVAINDEYYFYNGHKIYRVRIMIRSTEYQLWTDGNNDIRNVVKTLKLIN